MEKKNKCLEILKTLVSNMWYIVALVAIIAIIFLMIANWGVVLAVIGKFLTILMPFILGFFFACFINPLVKRVHSLLNRMKPGKGAKIKKAFSNHQLCRSNWRNHRFTHLYYSSDKGKYW